MRRSDAFKLASHPGLLAVLAVAALIAALALVSASPCATGFRDELPSIVGLVSVVLAVAAGFSAFLWAYGMTAKGIMFGVFAAVAVGVGWGGLSLLALATAYLSGRGGFVPWNNPCA